MKENPQFGEKNYEVFKPVYFNLMKRNPHFGGKNYEVFISLLRDTI